MFDISEYHSILSIMIFLSIIRNYYNASLILGPYQLTDELQAFNSSMQIICCYRYVPTAINLDNTEQEQGYDFSY